MTAYETADGLTGIALGEWSSGALPGVRMADRDLRLAARLRSRPRTAMLDVQPADQGVSVRTTGAVGVVRFTSFEVRVDAKLPGEHLNLFRMVEFAAGLDGITALAGHPGLQTADANLLDFIVDTLSAATQRIVAAGLRADYVEREGDLAALRGRLLPDRQGLERFGLYDRVICRYDEHEHDIADNQLLAVALGYGSRIATLPRVRRRARALAAILEDVCDPEAFPIERGPSAITYSRHNEHYRAAHALSWMVLQNRSLDDALATGRPRLRSFLIDMNSIFERFLERVLELALRPSRVVVEAQHTDSIFWRPDTGARYARVRPDILIRRVGQPHARLPVDAKYKRYDENKVDVDDLTQAFLYAYAYRDPQATSPPHAVLVHPTAVTGEPRATPIEVRSVSKRIVDARLTVLALHIPTVLDETNLGGGPSLDTIRAMSLRSLPADGAHTEALEGLSITR